MFIQETKRFGRIATLNPGAVPFNAERLRAALWGNKYDTYKILGGTKDNPFIRVVPDSTVVLRRNFPDESSGRAEDFQGLLTSARVHKRELNRLKRYGIGILNHTTFVVEHDPYYGTANVYSAVEQCHTKQNIEVRKPLAPEVYTRALSIGAGLLKYWRDHDSHTRQIVFDEVSPLFQYSETGHLFDYDLVLASGTFNRIQGLSEVAYDVGRLQGSERQERLYAELESATEKLLQAHITEQSLL